MATYRKYNSRVTYTYESRGRLSTMVTNHTYGDGKDILTETYTYRNPADGKTSAQVSKFRTQSIGDYDVTYEYTYDANGNILSAYDGTYRTRYEYDTAGQLLRENNYQAGKTWIYTYDDAGNITSKSTYAYTRDEDPGTPTDTVTYGYTNENWGDLLKSYDGTTLTYDNCGNLLNGPGWRYSWEHGRQLATMTAKDGSATWNFTYNADGLRTSRSNGSTTYKYQYLNGQLVKMTVADKEMYFNYDASGVPVSIVYNGTSYYYVTNLQGDVVGIVNQSGNQLVAYTYDAWGNVLTTTGSSAGSLGKYNPLRYRGYVYDVETKLYYLQSRYYNPEWGRFINADAIASTGQGILGYNMFAYCRNNPVRYKDSQGTKTEDAEENCGLVGAGIQLELDYGLTTVGVEIIVYWDIEQCRDNMMVAVYTYGGCSFDLTDPQLGSIIATLADSQEIIMANPEESLSQIVSVLETSYSASVSGVLIFANPDFKTVNDYEGAFLSVSGSIGHAKAGAAFSETCLAVTVGATSSKKPALGFSVTNYTLRGSYVITPHSAKATYTI